MVLGINALFAYSISFGTKNKRTREWRRSSFSLFAGFFLLLFQPNLPILISVCLANYMILSGFYLQIAAALMIEFRKNRFHRLFFPVISLVYWIVYPYFTFIRPDTSSRIAVISAFLTVIYLLGTFKLTGSKKEFGVRNRITKELIFIFAFSSIFYLLRMIITLSGIGAVQSLFDSNSIVSISLIFPLLFNVSYTIAVFLANLRRQNSRVLQEQEKQTALFNFLNDTARHLERDELFGSIERILKESLGVDTAAIFLKDEGEETYSIAYSFNELDLPLQDVWTLRKGEGAAGMAVSEDRVIRVHMDEYHNRTVAEAYLSRGCTELISAPLKSSGGIIGAVTIASSATIKSDLLDSEFFYYLGEQIGLVLHNAELYEQVSRTAGTDPLTGLYNRRRLLELLGKEIERSERYNQKLSLAMMDLDHFKSINDKYGHECGDDVLKQVAGLIREGCRQTDIISRWGGEEFLLVFIESGIEEAAPVCERIRSLVESTDLPCLEGRKVTVSAGLAPFKFSETIEKNVSSADSALYRAKESGRNRVTTVSED